MKDDLQTLRKEIDRVDERLVPLILERMEISRRIADVKRENGLPIHNAEREKDILERIRQKVGNEWGKYTCEIYRKIFEMSREYQKERLNSHGD